MSELSVITKISKRVSELTVDDLAIYCNEAGVTVSSLCVVLSRLLNAQRVVKWENGVDPIYDNDNNVQVKALGTALELLKLVGNRGGEMVSGVVTHQMAAGDIERLEAIASELKGLESRLVQDRTQQGVAVDAVVVADTVVSG